LRLRGLVALFGIAIDVGPSVCRLSRPTADGSKPSALREGVEL